MNNIWWSVFLLGILLFAGLLTVFLFQPGFNTEENTCFIISTERQKNGPSTNYAKTITTLNEQNSLNQFPDEIKKWRVYGNSAAFELEVARQLNAEVFIMRTYRKSLNDWPLFLSIVYAPTINSLHPPEVCYKSAGFTVESKEITNLHLTDADIVQRMENWQPDSLGEWFSGVMGISASTEIPVNRLVVAKNNGEKITERVLAYYIYIKDTNPMTEAYTTFRIATPIPSEGDYSKYETELRAFMDAALSNLLEPAIFENDRIMTVIIKQHGVLGYVILIGGLAIPLAMILIPLLTKKLKPIQSEQNG